MPTCIEGEERAIQLVRNPGQRMPISHSHRGKRPSDVLPAQPRANEGILKHIFGIVVVYEWVVNDRGVHEQGYEGQQQTETQYLPLQHELPRVCCFCDVRNRLGDKNQILSVFGIRPSKLSTSRL